MPLPVLWCGTGLPLPTTPRIGEVFEVARCPLQRGSLLSYFHYHCSVLKKFHCPLPLTTQQRTEGFICLLPQQCCNVLLDFHCNSRSLQTIGSIPGGPEIRRQGGTPEPVAGG